MALLELSMDMTAFGLVALRFHASKKDQNLRAYRIHTFA